jgi:hypothetical protein
MNEIDHFKKFVLCSSDVAAVANQLHVKRIHLVCFSYIISYRGCDLSDVWKTNF